MPSNYKFTDTANGNIVRNFDDIFVTRDSFDTTAVGGPGNFTVSGQDIEDYFIDDQTIIDNFIGDTLWTWGTNLYGNLGINAASAAARSTPVTTILGGTNWKSISGGSYSRVAIKTNGTLWTWGENTDGQLGINGIAISVGHRSTPVTTFLGGTNWKSVKSSGTFTAAIKTDGTLWTWGYNFNGQLGHGDNNERVTPTRVGSATNWKSVATGSNHTIAIKTDGTLWTWGLNDQGQLGHNDTTSRSTPTQLGSATNWKTINNTSNHTIAIKTDGTLWTWGYNFSGELGLGDRVSRSTPVTTILGGNYWKYVAGGTQTTLAIKTDGTLWTWGSNDNGQLGHNDTVSRSTPTQLGSATNWKVVSGAFSSSMGIKTDGTLWCWGSNTSRQLGTFDTIQRLTPTTTFRGGTNWKSVTDATGAAITAGLTVDLS